MKSSVRVNKGETN